MNKLMDIVKNKAAFIVTAGVALCASASAMAADTDAGVAAFTALKTNAESYITEAWVVFGVIVGASVAMKLVKKFINKAS